MNCARVTPTGPKVIRHEGIESYVAGVARALRPFGACNFQLRLRGQEPVAFEINPRCSGTTAARALAGFNEPLMMAHYLLRGSIPDYTISEIMVFRYWAEMVVSRSRFPTLPRGAAARARHGICDSAGKTKGYRR